MQDESPIVWNQSGAVRSDVALRVLTGLVGIAGVILLPFSGVPGLGILVGWLVLAFAAVWGFRSASGRLKEQPLRFLVYRDRMIAEHARSKVPAVFSFSNVSKFERVSEDSEYPAAMSGVPKAVRITPVRGPIETLTVYRDSAMFVAILNDRLEQYHEILAGDGRRP